MNTIQRLFRWLFRSETKNQKPHIKENTAPSLIQAAPVPKPVPFTDDDSPPGFKIRWHF